MNINSIEMLLKQKQIEVEKTFDEGENEYFRRVTIELKNVNGMKFYCFPLR